MTALDDAGALLATGWQPIPIPYGKKRPVLENWTEVILQAGDLAAHFNGSRTNIGNLNGMPSGLPEGGRVDVDLDSDEAVAVAPLLLPLTDRTSGRERRPRSHYWYDTADTPPAKAATSWNDPARPKGDAGWKLVELRSTGSQTVLPPSRHPDGDAYIWHEQGTPARITTAALVAAVNQVAGAALLARNWPGANSHARHELALAVSGFLLRGGVDTALTRKVIVAAALAAGDEEAEARGEDVRTTADRLAANEAATGFTTATTLLPESVLTTIGEWLGCKYAGGTTHLAAPVEPEGRKQPPQAARLAAFAEKAELFSTPAEEPYATVTVDGHRATWPVRGKAMRDWLLRSYYEDSNGAVPSAQALGDALRVIEARARFSGNEKCVFTRLAPHNGEVYIDLGDETWRAVRLCRGGWSVVADPPVRFRRARGMLPLPAPERGGTVDELRPLLNLRTDTDGDWYLVLGWLIGALAPIGPYPVLNFNGEQGSAKSFATRVCRDLIDPGAAPLRAEPRELRDLMISATNSWLVSFDNLSSLQPWLSDAFCRLATGGGFAVREHYENSEEILFDAQRSVLLNGITEIISRPDLLDRSILVTLPAIPDTKRQPESDLRAAVAAARPRILGALYDAVCVALRNLATTHLDEAPRMVDFARFVTAAEPALGWPPGSFVKAYADNREGANDLALESHPFVPLLTRLISSENAVWNGTATELLLQLEATADETVRKRAGWPKDGARLIGALKRLAPNLRTTGIETSFSRSKRRRLITLQRIDTSPTPHDREKSVTSVTTPDTASPERHRAGASVTFLRPSVTPLGLASPIQAQNDAGDAGDARTAPFWGDEGDDGNDGDTEPNEPPDWAQLPNTRECSNCGDQLDRRAPGVWVCAGCGDRTGYAVRAELVADAAKEGA